MKSRLFVPWLILLACLTAAVTPALAREGVSPDAPGRADLQQHVRESTSRYRQAKAEVDRLAAEVARIEKRLAGVEDQQADLRALATRGAAALYMRDSSVDWLHGFGDGGAEVLDAARRARLVGGVNELAGAAARNLGDSAKQIAEDRRRLKDRRQEQQVALSQLNGERQAAAGQFSAFVAAERDEQRRAETVRRQAVADQRKAEAAQRKADAAARAAQRTSRASDAAGRARPSVTGEWVCPLNAPFKWGDGWGAGRGHRGTDLLAPRGTENLAVVPGTFETRFWGGGGLTLFLMGDDGNTYVYMHLLRVVGEPRHVEAGEVIGLTGASGNASAYHLHFEFHPGGQEAVDPYPVLVAHCPPMPRDH
ncbi:MAG TPA: peptidoglycan DD-metalloendopeptidase family protein [Acidimicrobiia bacterium]|nr:peptidoglycan DD-metalloendopeptidase family protein [Acidimicrobiia bacterium]